MFPEVRRFRSLDDQTHKGRDPGKIGSPSLGHPTQRRKQTRRVKPAAVRAAMPERDKAHHAKKDQRAVGLAAPPGVMHTKKPARAENQRRENPHPAVVDATEEPRDRDYGCPPKQPRPEAQRRLPDAARPKPTRPPPTP